MAIDKAQVEDIYPLSPMQEGLLFEALFDEGSAAYFLQMTLRFVGEIDERVFAESWRLLAQRHAVLRSAFVHEGVARPVQVVLKNREVAIEFEDVRPLGREAQDEVIGRYKTADQQRGFDLQKDALMRIEVFRREERLYELVWSYHHILLDGWCLGILQQEFVETYRALYGGRRPNLRPVSPYRNYIKWLGKQDKSQAAAYWRAYLAGYEERAGIPSGGGSSTAAGYELGEEFVEIPAEVSAQLRALTVQQGVTLNTLVQALWGVLLGRYNRLDEVVLGAVVSGRPSELPGIEEMVGLFINTVPVRVKLERERPFTEVLKQIQRDALAGEPYHHLPLAEIQAVSGLGNDLFDHVLVFENYPLDTAAEKPSPPKDDFSFHMIGVHDRTHYDFDVTVLPGESIDIKFSFNSRVYAPEQIRRVAAHWQTAVASVLANPAQAVGEIEILPTAERRELLETFNNYKREYPVERPIHLLFVEQAARTPERMAIEHGTECLTYAELDAQSDEIAAVLLEKGVRPNDFVGILAERGCQFLVAMLGVLKAGGAFLPIDPSYPAERVRYMVEDSQARFVMVDERGVEKMRGYRPEHVIELDAKAQRHGEGRAELKLRTSNTPIRPYTSNFSSRNYAYILYTSGSTGRPKGAIVRHDGAVNHMFAEYELLEFRPETAFLQSAPSSSDIAVWQFLGPVLMGGRTVVADLETVADPERLLALLKEKRITLIELVPVVMKALLDYVATLPAAKRQLPDLAWAMVTGEAVSPVLVNQWLATYPAVKLVNAYGPTEAADDVCQQVIAGPLPLEQHNVSIGRPIPNMALYVLDEQLRLQPLGMPGEICVAGIGVGAGYWNNQSKTEAAFVENPYAADEHEHVLYRTGDLGRWRSKGTLEFLGRLDYQVKVRGFRIELGEIEAVLGQHTAVAEAVVVARTQGEAVKQLVGYVITGEGFDAAEVRQFLRECLPEHMVPAVLVAMDAFPLTPNGKIDRKALPALEQTAVASGYIAPRNETEQALVEIWQAVLQLEQIGVHDNFFELGGHSLKAMQVVTRVLKGLDKKLGLRDFFNAPTIAELAQLLTKSELNGYDAIAPAPLRPYYPLSYAQRRLWLMHQVDKAAAYNMPEAYRLAGEIDVMALERAFATMIERHEALRTAFVVVEGEPVQRILPEVAFSMRVVDLSGKEEGEQKARAIADEEANRPFELERPPLLRAAVVRLPDEQNLFLLTVHHIIGDGWSGTVLYQEILTLYEAYRSGRPNPLPPLRIQYKDFAVWQHARGWGKEEAYWLETLAGMPDYLQLPTDFARQEERNFKGGMATAEITGEELAKLRALASERHTTLANVTLALFNLLLYQLSKQEDFCVGVAIANRDHPDLENLLGFFVNVLPVRVRLDAEMDFAGLLGQVIEQMHGALEHQEYPLDLLVQKLNPVRVANRQPLVNVIYGFQNFTDVTVDIGVQGAAQANKVSNDNAGQLQAFDFSFETAKFDLTLFVVDEGDKLVFSLEYDAHLFRPKSVQRYVGALVRFAGMVG